MARNSGFPSERPGRRCPRIREPSVAPRQLSQGRWLWCFVVLLILHRRLGEGCESKDGLGFLEQPANRVRD